MILFNYRAGLFNKNGLNLLSMGAYTNKGKNMHIILVLIESPYIALTSNYINS